ncbi:hypothetical protein PVAND_011075 [Polypedilum vanderplanki]|uniref:Uncharacterized protein n=1 Tax=Polypedilum vanderplanki TaxID=319348 RepID=A0A9J6CI83_POLVA|nr:hypothetical protein PVAND_011075 [Polypedilum vanderplanki]
MKFTFSTLFFCVLTITCNCSSIRNYEINDKNMNARDLVNGLANRNVGLDFDISGRDRVGFSSSGIGFSSGIDSNKKAIVDGITHGNERFKVEETHINKVTNNPFTMFVPQVFDPVINLLKDRSSTTAAPHIAFIDTIGSGGPYKYENSKTTSVQVGDQKIERRNEDLLGRTIFSFANFHLNNNRPNFFG